MSTSLPTRVLTFGGAAIQIEFTAGRSAEIVDFLFKRMSCGAVGDAPPISLRLSEDPTDGAFTLSGRDAVYCIDRSAGVVASWLLHVICRQVADGATTGLLLHAGAVRWGGRSLLLPGASGCGKSTLIAFLATRGFDYLTDELVHVPLAPAAVEGFATPLKIKKAGLGALEGYVPLPTEAAATMEGTDGVLVELASSQRQTASVPVAAIIFPQYQRRSRFRLKALSRAQAAVRLMAGILNAEALPDHGFGRIARLAGVTSAYEMRYGHLGQIEEQLERLRLLASAAEVPIFQLPARPVRRNLAKSPRPRRRSSLPAAETPH